jgi:hypothetical protein
MVIHFTATNVSLMKKSGAHSRTLNNIDLILLIFFHDQKKLHYINGTNTCVRKITKCKSSSNNDIVKKMGETLYRRYNSTIINRIFKLSGRINANDI